MPHAAVYGSRRKRVVISRSLFTGTSSSIETLLRHLLTHNQRMISNETKLLSKKHIRFTDTIENNQKGHPLKNQSFVSSDKSVTITGRYMKETYLFKQFVDC